MKKFANRSVTKKVLIVILTVMLLTFSVPKPVHAAGGILLGPITALCTTLVDSVQHILERFMLGEWNSFMKEIDDTDSYNSNGGGAATVNLDADGVEIGGAWWGDITGTEIPVIQYTPEEIFSNRVPALDVNFIKPSVTTGNTTWDNEHNIAIKLRPTIASWYIAMRTLALVGLLSVLVYLGIRMLLTGIAADKAKYKKMLMDWIVAMCLLFALHYIMSFALTMSEVVTSMIADTTTGSITVSFEGHTFTGNLMSYVRFMIQAKDTGTAVGFFLLYIMLMIYTVKFTWIYLKRVVNMAFLTLIAPLIAVTYPIDKVSDGKAQAFELWIKEFTYNALLQPLHLLLYIVLLGSATELVALNPLYAVVCLGFITAGEKLFKKMFGFDKASGGTLGSLAAAAGLTGVANKAIMAMRKGGPKGGPGKVRTNDKYQRAGKDPGANKGFNSFDKDGNQGLAELPDVSNEEDAGLSNGGENQSSGGKRGGEVPPPNGNDGGEVPFAGQEEMDALGKELDEMEANGNAWNDPELREQMEQKQARYAELEAEKNAQEDGMEQQDNGEQEEPDTSGSPDPGMTQDVLENLGPETTDHEQGFFETVGKDVKNFGGRVGDRFNRAKTFFKDEDVRHELFEKGKKKAITGIRRNAIAAWKAAPSTGLNALKTAGRVGGSLAMGAVAGATGAALTGDAEQSLGMAFAGAAGGNALSGKVLNGTVGKINHNTSTSESFGAAKYGSTIDARNAKADKEYVKSKEYNEEYEKYFKEGQYKMSKAEFKQATLDYRKVGITDTKTIRKALHLEAQYAKNNKDAKEVRGKVQNIVQTYDGINKKAVYGENKEATEAALKNLESQLTKGSAKQKRAIANEILQGYRDWYNVS